MNTATASVAATPQSFKEVWLISIGHSLTHWYIATFYLLLPLIGKELGLSFTEIGFIMTVQYAIGAISNIPGGIFVDTVGRKGLLMAIALFWIGVPYALMSLAQNYWMLLMCVTLVGMANNLWHPAAIPTLAYRYPDRKGLVLSIHGMGGNLGEALAPLVIGALLGWLSWRMVVIVNVVPGFAMAVFILIMLHSLTTSAGGHANDRGKKRSVGEYLRGFGGLFKNKPLMLIAASSAVRSMTQHGLMTFLPVYLAYEMGYSPLIVGVCMTMLQIAGFVAAPVAGHLSDKLGRKYVISGSMTLAAITIIGMALAGTSMFFVLFIALAGFFLYATRAVIQAWAVESTPKDLAGSGVGLLFATQAAGGSISPVIFGMIADAHGLSAGFYFLAATIVCSTLLVFFVPVGASTQSKPAAA